MLPRSGWCFDQNVTCVTGSKTTIQLLTNIPRNQRVPGRNKWQTKGSMTNHSGRNKPTSCTTVRQKKSPCSEQLTLPPDRRSDAAYHLSFYYFKLDNAFMASGTKTQPNHADHTFPNKTLCDFLLFTLETLRNTGHGVNRTHKGNPKKTRENRTKN